MTKFKNTYPKEDDEALLMQYLFDETVALFHRLRVTAEQVHHRQEMSAGGRGILKDLARNGAQTVPQMARTRFVSRQHIQTLVNLLIDEGYVELLDNPAHKSSHLVSLTATGKNLIEEMNLRETKLLTALETDIDLEDLQTTVQVLQQMRQLLASKQWQQLLETNK
ncbi:MAG: MarR family winged helix-turn-helix transcriptional regulator [Nostocaceae cyanobacterium]|nr:MarR family winged helix-turn-helix transcriptional regulator [Nostocaceae cyanobacterium]